MYKKLIALLIVCTLLVSIPPAVAADDTVPRPTVDEILNEYYQKALEAEAAGEASAAAYSPRSGQSGKTLEQETVETLTAAGYEAYNVIGDNYEALEEELNTDFSEMGLDPEGSYVVVISGEDPDQPASAGGESTYNLNPRPEQDEAPDGGDLSYFFYSYNGKLYKMRYVTVASNGADELYKDDIYFEADESWLTDHMRTVFDTTIIGVTDSIVPNVPLGTLASLIFDSPETHVFRTLRPGSLVVHMATNWTCSYLQVWNEQDQTWDSSHFSEYATSMVYCSGSVFDPDANRAVPVVYNPQYFTTYSYYYHNTEKRLEFAMKAYDHYTIYHDTVSSVSFYWGNTDGEILLDGGKSALLGETIRSLSIVLPSS